MFTQGNRKRRGRARAARLAACVAVALVTAGAAATTGQGATRAATATVSRADTLVLGQFRVPTGLIANPYIAASDPLVSDGIHQLVYEPLFYVNYETGKSEPWLATSATYSKDFKTITINLRHDVTWSDGKPFTSKDVVFTMSQIIKTKPTPWRAANIQASVASSKALGAYRVQVKLKAPNPRFIDSDLSSYIYTSNFTPLPQHIFQGKPFKTFSAFDLKKGWPVGTGPYRVTSVSPTSVALARNDSWWAASSGFSKLPAPKRIVYTAPGPEDSAIASLVGNKLDYAGESVPTVAGFITARGKNPKLTNWDGDLGWNDPCPFSLTINTQQAPWNDPEMRWALNEMINKEQFSRVFNTPGKPTPAETTFPAYPKLDSLIEKSRDLLTKYPTLKYDPSAAGATLTAKGFTNRGGKWYGSDGNQLTVKLSIFSPAALGPAWGDAATLLQQQLNAAGVAVDLQPSDFNTIVTARTNGDFSAQSWFECGSVTDPWATLNRYTDALGADNPGKWSNPQYNAIVAQMGQLSPSDKRIPTLFRQAFGIWLRELPVIPLTQRPEPIVVNSTYWTGWPSAKNDYTYPAPWGQNFHQVILHLKQAKAK